MESGLLPLLAALAAPGDTVASDTAAAAAGGGNLALWLFGGIGVVTVLIGVIVALALRIRGGARGGKLTMNDRIRPYIDTEYIKEIRAAEEKAKDEFKLIRAAGERIGQLNFLQNYRDKLGLKLLKAGLRIKPQEFLVINLIVLVMVGGLGFIITRSFIFGCLFLGLGAIAPHIWVWMKTGARVKLFNNQLVDGLTLMSNSLKAGYGFMQAIQLLSEESPAPLGEEFARVVRENSLGVPLEDALGGMVSRVESADLDLCITAVLIQRQIGGNLSEILDSIAFTIRERIRIKGQIQTLTAQGRLGGMVIALLPLALGLVMAMLQTEMMELFVKETLGRIMIGVGLFMQTLGAIAIKKVISIEV